MIEKYLKREITEKRKEKRRYQELQKENEEA